MKTDRFKVTDSLRKLVVVLEGTLINYPNKYLELKKRTLSYSYEALRLCYEANCLSDKSERIKTMERALSYVTMLDFALNFSMDKELITKKKYTTFANSLSDVNKYAMGWIKAIRSEDEKEKSGKANYANIRLKNEANARTNQIMNENGENKEISSN